MDSLKKFSLVLTAILINSTLIFAQKVKTVDISKPGTEKNEPTIMVSAPLNGASAINPDVKPDLKVVSPH